MCTLPRTNSSSNGNQNPQRGRQRLIVTSLIIVLLIVVAATVSAVLVSNRNKANAGNNGAVSSSSPQQGQQQTFEFYCTNDDMTTESEICYDSSQDCVAVFCCETTTTSISNIVDECLSSSLELFKCAEANASIPTNENCPALPFYAIPKVWENNGDMENELTIGAVGDVILESTLQRQAARHGSYAES